MGFQFYYSNGIQRRLCLLISLLFMSTSQLPFFTEGRTPTQLLRAADRGSDKKISVRAMIGSRPPTCDKRCITCGHCEAVQVPAVPQIKSGLRMLSTGIATSRGDDDSSNYKPMSWKCKCGGMIFNP